MLNEVGVRFQLVSMHCDVYNVILLIRIEMRRTRTV